MNNAAIYGDYVGSDHSLEYLKQVFDVNLHGQWVMAKVVAPHLVKQRWGRIINVASIAAYLHQLSAGGDPDDFELSNYAYMQSKWGVLGLTRHMAGQLGRVQRHRQLHRARAHQHRGHREAGAHRLPADVRHHVGDAAQHRARAHGRARRCSSRRATPTW